MRLLLLALSFLLISTEISAQTNLRLVVSDPSEVSEGKSPKRQAHLNQMVLEALQKRTEAAGMRGTQVTNAGSDLKISVPKKWKRSFIDPIVLAPGRLEVRALSPMAVDWVQKASQLPVGVELRGAAEPFLWSADRRILDQVAEKFSTPTEMVVVAKHPEGWRTYSGTQVLGREADIDVAKADRSPNGGAFISIRFRTSMVDRLATPAFLDVKTWLVILDGEVLGLVSSTALATGSIELSAPVSLPSDGQRQWVSQVAGRLAAPLPIPVAILPE